MTAQPSDSRVTDNPERKRYEIFVGGDLAGFLRYRSENGRVVLEHTEVAAAFGGRGLGGTLVGQALDDLAGQGRRIRVECEFAQRFIDRHPQYSDMLD